MDLPDFSKIFHESSKDLAKGHPLIPADSNEWPEEWKTTYYKAYPRLPKIALDADLRGLDADLRGPKADFFELIKKRRSRRDFTRTLITKRELSLLLKYSCGNMGPLEKSRHRRAQASGGARFPIEVYPIIFRSAQARTPKESLDDPTGQANADSPAKISKGNLGGQTQTDAENVLKAGLYHYNVKDHALDVLWDREFSDDDIGQIFTYPWVRDAAIGIVMTAVFSRNQSKYGERGYRYILLEAGHIGQNIYLVSEALGLKCCALGGTRDENLEKLIDIDGVTESVVYGFAVGK